MKRKRKILFLFQREWHQKLELLEFFLLIVQFQFDKQQFFFVSVVLVSLDHQNLCLLHQYHFPSVKFFVLIKSFFWKKKKKKTSDKIVFSFCSIFLKMVLYSSLKDFFSLSNFFCSFSNVLIKIWGEKKS